MNIFAVINPTTNEKVFVFVGQVGYYPAPPTLWPIVRATQTDDVTESALAGSMFGWSGTIAKLACDWSKETTQEILI